ncbi:MAG: hypothetical protein HY235_12240 [Acidobacteria bacterium]|nr:hypothetical protein [Acidobacteriota bacterium]
MSGKEELHELVDCLPPGRVASARKALADLCGDLPAPSSQFPDARRIEDVLRELAAEVPREEWDRLPPGLTDDLDRYLYGTPER